VQLRVQQGSLYVLYLSQNLAVKHFILHYNSRKIASSAIFPFSPSYHAHEMMQQQSPEGAAGAVVGPFPLLG
jgi:hypothetical protein